MARTKVTTDVLADDAVTSAKIADDAVGNDQLAGSLTVDINGGAIDGAVIGANSAAAGTFSTVTDAKGGLRQIPGTTVTLSGGNSYTLVADNVGRWISVNGNVVVPASVFSEGDAISIYNNTTGNITITCSAITTAYKAGTNTDVNSVTLETRGIATILFIEATVCVITGNLA